MVPMRLWSERCSCRQAAQSAHQEALRKLEEESRRQRQFHAQPLPRTTKSGVAFAPVVSPILTMPEPFKLESEKRHEEVAAAILHT